MDTKLFERFAVLSARKKALETQIEVIKDELKELETALLEQSMEGNIQNMTVIVGYTEDGLPVKRTVYRERTVRAGRGDEIEALQLNQALKEAGLHEYVKENVNLNQLSAYVRGFDPDKNRTPEEILAEMPDPLKKVIQIRVDYKMKSTNA